VGRRPQLPPNCLEGPFTVAAARAGGLTLRQVRGEQWQRLGPGVYGRSRLPATPLLALETVALRLPPEAAFSGRTGGWLHRMPLDPCDPIEVTVPRDIGVSARSGVLLRRVPLLPSEVVRINGLRVTAPLRTVTDLGRRLPLIEAVVAVDLALHAGLVELDTLQTLPPIRGHGMAQLRRVIALAEPLAESPAETRLRLILVLAGLPRPTAQMPLLDANGEAFGRGDLCYEQARLVIEYDGATHKESLTEDAQRQNRIIAAGYRILRFTAADLRRPELIVAQVRAALAGRMTVFGA
jgi:uncharacterized protein DUF559